MNILVISPGRERLRAIGPGGGNPGPAHGRTATASPCAADGHANAKVIIKSNAELAARADQNRKVGMINRQGRRESLRVDDATGERRQPAFSCWDITTLTAGEPSGRDASSSRQAALDGAESGGSIPVVKPGGAIKNSSPPSFKGKFDPG
ncbi:hypothetical protein HA052_16270 [Chromobacterium haemolyticum]|uniref:DUF2188 domain-containing protein n=1 Tax=Chromobacterium fluminis TaxID=3044269 RepID=A0ABX0LBF5_9NEIS|nr:hypothetical protein [Chromobacterium haemolyticum]NHR06746.1 hypothetical protein [Chromobacterium haemolyticum]